MQQLAKRLSRTLFVLFFGLFCSVGCSGEAKLNMVKGKVTLKGQPLAGALVTFHPKGNNDIKVDRPTGLTKEDGTFAVQTGQKDGASAGDYVVTIICITSPPKKEDGKKALSTEMSGRDDSFDRLQGKYANKETSKINVTIKGGDNQLDAFALD